MLFFPFCQGAFFINGQKRSSFLKILSIDNSSVVGFLSWNFTKGISVIKARGVCSFAPPITTSEAAAKPSVLLWWVTCKLWPKISGLPM